MIKAKNIISDKGNPITNQIIITDYKKVKGFLNKKYNASIKETFQSYDSIIAVKDHKKGKTTLDEYYWNYSRTTSKYRNIFLNETIEETKRKIKEGIYKLANLNK